LKLIWKNPRNLEGKNLRKEPPMTSFKKKENFGVIFDNLQLYLGTKDSPWEIRVVS